MKTYVRNLFLSSVLKYFDSLSDRKQCGQRSFGPTGNRKRILMTSKDCIKDGELKVQEAVLPLIVRSGHTHHNVSSVICILLTPPPSLTQGIIGSVSHLISFDFHDLPCAPWTPHHEDCLISSFRWQASFLQVITNFPETSDTEENVEVASKESRVRQQVVLRKQCV